MKNRRGLTLVEMLVAITLASLLGIVVSKVFLVNNQVFTKNVSFSNIQTQARLSLRSLTTDIKSTRRINYPDVGMSANNLSLTVNTEGGATQIITYHLDLNTDILTRTVGTQTTRLAKNVVNDGANPIFGRTTQNNLSFELRFRDEKVRPANSFTYSAVLNTKSRILLLAYQDDGVDYNLNAVDALSADNIWAAGDSWTVLNYTNGKWEDFHENRSKAKPGEDLLSIKMLYDNLGYAGATSGKLARYSAVMDDNWRNIDILRNDQGYYRETTGIFPKDTNEILVAGDARDRWDGGVIFYLDDSVYLNGSQGTPNTQAGDEGIQTPSFNYVIQYMNDKWAFGFYGTKKDSGLPSSSVWREVSALAWEPQLTGFEPTPTLRSGSIVPDATNTANYTMWVVGNGGTILRYYSSSNTWTNFTDASVTSNNLNSVSFFNQENGFIIGDNGTILRFDGVAFERLESPAGNIKLNGVDLYGDDAGWIVGDSGSRIKMGEY